jgi:RNA ligase (TIGR02306 family)
MSSWKVSREKIEMFPHPKADKLELGKVGTYQVVVQKGLYKNGDEVVFAPEKSVLTGRLLQEYTTWLAGPEKNRVKAVRLREELSCGIIVPNELVKDITGKDVTELPEGEDISELFGITKYVPPIPTHLAGEVEVMPSDKLLSKHDVEQFGVYASQFVTGERVVASEKIHGSQGVFYMRIMPDGSITKWASSKGQTDKGLSIKESDTNAYYMAAKDSGLWDLLKALPMPDGCCPVLPDESIVIQAFAELVPCQGGNWTYGKNKPSILLFDIRMDKIHIPYDKVSPELKALWVPIPYDGPYDPTIFQEMANGKEKVSGQELHISEGLVLRPYIDRRASDGVKLMVKIISKHYKETGEEFN